MSIRNKKTKTSKATVSEDKLKAKLKESRKKVLKEEEEDFDEEGFGDEDMDLGGGSEESIGDDMSGDDFSGDEEFDFDEEGSLDDTELTEPQEEFVDSQVDELLDPAEDIISQQESDDDELSLNEADEDFDVEAEDDFDVNMGGDEDFDVEGSDDLDLETDESDLEDVVEGDTEIDSTFSSEELQSIINSPNTIDSLKSELSDVAQEEVPAGTEGDEGEDFDEESASLEESLLVEAELMNEIKREMKKLRESEVASTVKSLDFTEESTPDTEDTYSKVSKGEGKVGAQSHKTASLGTMKQEIKEEAVKKSKMIVKLAKQVLALQKKEKELKLENFKLVKANGLLAAAGEKLDSKSRVKIVESFSKCKDAAQVQTLYKKIVNVIKEKARGTIKEAIQRKGSSVKTFNSFIKEDAGSISKVQERANYLMGLPGSEDSYMSNF